MATNGTRQQPTAANSRQEALAQQTWAEHDALLIAIHSLEAALAAAAPGRERLWARHVAEMLKGVADALAEHIASTEDPDGLFAETTIPGQRWHITSSDCDGNIASLSNRLAHWRFELNIA